MSTIELPPGGPPTTAGPPPPPVPTPDEVRREYLVVRSRADRVYRGLATASGASTLVLMGLIAVFLLWQSRDALGEMGLGFFTTQEWNVTGEDTDFGVVALVFGTVVVALIAMTLAVPLAVGTALFINEYAPLRTRKILTALVDLMAAIPSLIYGIVGQQWLNDRSVGITEWLDSYLGWIPLFDAQEENPTASMFVAGIVVALMVFPITTSVIREVFSQAPRGEAEAALALGGTRWGMIRTVILPFGRGGIIGGSMLGLGRALGETIAVAMVLSSATRVSVHITDPGGATIASWIANRFSEAANDPLAVSALMAAGLVLFLMTLVVNMLASIVVSRSRSGAGVEL